MNNTYYETFDENFNKALELYEKSFSHDELINLLKTGNIVQKQIAAFRLENILSQTDCDVLISNLTGQDGKIREAVSFKLKDFLSNSEYHKFFLNQRYYDIYLEAIIDINGNICRNVISAISNLLPYKDFYEYFSQSLTNLTNELIKNVNRFDFSDGKYKVNKEVFKLYWCLETIYEFTNVIKCSILKDILLKTKAIGDYTIREKTAKILSKIECDDNLSKIKNELKSDRNYYVRRF